MNTIESKRVILEFAAGVLACGVAAFLIVLPAERRLAEQHEKVASLLACGAGAGGTRGITEPQLRTLAQRAAEEAGLIAGRGAAARDETAIYSLLMTLAERHHVRVDHLQPVAPKGEAGSPAATPAAPTQPGSPAAPAPPRDSKARYSLSLAAGYADFVHFLAALSGADVYAVIRSIHLNTGDGSHPDGVQALVEAELFSFDIAAVTRLATAQAPGARAAPEATR